MIAISTDAFHDIENSFLNLRYIVNVCVRKVELTKDQIANSLIRLCSLVYNPRKLLLVCFHYLSFGIKFDNFLYMSIAGLICVHF